MATYDINSLPSRFVDGDIINCSYSGSVKSIKLPKGLFRLECWGARGGGGSTEAASPANGGYSRGDYSTDGNSMLYLVCGEHGYADKNCERRTYNGGGRGGICGMLGSNTYFGSGGGATHIATQSGVLSELSESRNSIIMVAGGGSAKYSGDSGGSTVYLQGNACGGGEAGGDCGLAIAKSPGSKFSVNRYSTAGTQTSGGTSGAVNYNGSAVGGSNGSFGAGGDGYSSDSLNVGSSGGGGGYYGGGGGSSLWILDLLILRNIGVYGSGGSGYISSALQNAVTVQEPSTSSNPDSNNHGYIRITVLSIPKYYFTATAGTGISRAVSLSKSLVPGSVSGNTGGYSPYYNGSISYTTLDGSSCVAITNNTANAYPDGAIIEGITLTPGKQYFYKVEYNAPVGKDIRIGMRLSNGGSTENVFVTGTGTWKSVYHIFTATSSMTGQIEVVENGPDSTQHTWYTRNVTIKDTDGQGYDGDQLGFYAEVQDGYKWDGWYSGNTKVSSSQYYLRNVAGSDVSLQARAVPATKRLTVNYGGSNVIDKQVTPPVAITYDGTQIASVSSGQTKTLNCSNKLMSSNVIIGAGGGTLLCSGKIMETNIVVVVS